MVEVSVLPGRERRRKWSADDKLRIAEESYAPGARVAEVARRHGLHPNQLHLWRRQAREGGPSRLPATPRFAAVAVATEADAAVDAGGGAGIIEIVLRNGRIVRLRLGLAQVAHLADALERSVR
jgi:transposase